jgi:cyclase
VSSSAREHPQLAPPRVEEVSEDVYAYIQPDGSWWINNTGFLVGAGGVVSVDSCSTEHRSRAYRAAISAVSAGPVHTLVNTHHHGDHTNGNYQFAGATIVAHHRCRTEMIATGLPGARVAATWDAPDWGALESAPPFLTYSEGVDLWVDEMRCEVRHLGTAAHTTNDSIVWIPERSLLFAGDLLMKGGTPFIMAGSLRGAIESVNSLQTLGARIVVPGHGPVCGPEVIGEVLGYLNFVDSLATRAHAAGLSPLEAARESGPGEFADLLDPERLVGNLHRAYAELDGVAPGGPMDRAAALRDMVTYNGGAPLTCLA